MYDPVLALHNISFVRGERSNLTDIFWQVAPAQIAAILGPNGCGKSTLLRIIAGYLWPQKGRVELFGEFFGEVPLAPLRARIGVLEATTVYPFNEIMTALDLVVSGYTSSLTVGYVEPSAEQIDHAKHLLEQVGLATHVDQLYFTLSTGERLRCLLARALVRKPALLLLDEPTAGLDLPARESVLATLARLHRNAGTAAPTMITITHHLEELSPDLENVLLLSHDGHMVAQGKPEEVLTSQHLSAAYGLPIHVTHHNRRYQGHVDPRTWDQLL